MSYEWKNNLACKATYVINTDYLDQLESILIPFDEAADYKIEYMTSYPSDAGIRIREKWAQKMSSKFIKYVFKIYDIRQQIENSNIRNWYNDLWVIYENGEKTLTDIAEVTDKHCKFIDE